MTLYLIFNPSPELVGDPIFGYATLEGTVFAFSGGYFAYDLLVSLWYVKINGWPFVLHAVACCFIFFKVSLGMGASEAGKREGRQLTCDDSFAGFHAVPHGCWIHVPHRESESAFLSHFFFRLNIKTLSPSACAVIADLLSPSQWEFSTMCAPVLPRCPSLRSDRILCPFRFLHIHWWLDKLNMTGSIFQLVNGVLLIASFFGARIAYGGYMTFVLWRLLDDPRINPALRWGFRAANIALNGQLIARCIPSLPRLQPSDSSFLRSQLDMVPSHDPRTSQTLQHAQGGQSWVRGGSREGQEGAVRRQAAMQHYMLHSFIPVPSLRLRGEPCR